jgi:hypothetical protein
VGRRLRALTFGAAAVEQVRSLSPGPKASLAAALVRSVSSELALAASREFALVPWDDDALAPRAVDLFVTGPEDRPRELFCDAVALRQPSVRFAVWATEILLGEFALPELADQSGRLFLLPDWAWALRSPGVRLKVVAARMLACMARAPNQPAARDALRAVLDKQRLARLAQLLLTRGGTGARAVHSKWTMAVVELVSLL